MVEGKLCGILTSGDEINYIPGIGNRVSKDRRQGSRRDVKSTFGQ